MSRSLFAGCLLASPLGPGSAWAEPSGELRARLEGALAELALPGARIHVAVRGGEVLLYGRVKLLDHALRAERAAWKTEDVADVENEIRALPSALVSDAEIDAEIRNVLRSDARFRTSVVQLEVRAGAVVLRGRIQNPSDVLALKHRVAAIGGVLSVEIEAMMVARSGAAT